MLNSGYILFHRHWLRHPAMKGSARRRFLWVHILCSAYFEDSKDGQIKAGQFIATRKQLADACGLSMSALKCAIADFVDAGMLTVTSVGRGFPSVWTVPDYTLTQANSGRWSADHPTDHHADYLTDHHTDHPTDYLGSSGNAGDQRPDQGFEKVDEPPHGLPDGLSHGPPHEQFANPHNKQETIKNSESKTKNQSPAPGPWATDPQPASTEPLVEPPPAKDEKKPKKPKPSVKPIGDWPGIDVDQKWKGYKFPEEFNAIWAPWLLTQKRNSNVKAIGKQNSYRLILNWLHDGLTPADVLRATKDYMREFWNDPNKTHCVHPATFYSRANPTLPDRIAAFAGTTGPAPIRDRWHNPRDAWRECVSLANHLGVEIPDVPKRAYGAEWEDVEAFHPLVIQYATDRAGFKTMPDDLAQQVRGSE
jgi:hypothetical protein